MGLFSSRVALLRPPLLPALHHSSPVAPFWSVPRIGRAHPSRITEGLRQIKTRELKVNICRGRRGAGMALVRRSYHLAYKI